MKQTTDEIIAILRARDEGKTIEWRDYQTPTYWQALPPDVAMRIGGMGYTHEYRIKPEPREIWLQYVGSGLWQEKFAGIGEHFREVL